MCMLSRMLTPVHEMDFDEHEQYLASSDGAFVSPVVGGEEVVIIQGRREAVLLFSVLRLR